MRNRRGLAAAAVVVLVLGAASGQDGLPDLAGSWEGSSKGKEASLDPLNAGGVAKSGFTADFAQAGPDLAATLVNDGDPAVDLAGSAGNGNFWLDSGNPDYPFLITGRSDGKAAHLKGRFLAGGPDRAMDGTFKAGRSALAMAAADLRPSLVSAPAKAAAAPPSIEGAWAGTISGKNNSLETGGKPQKVKIPVTMTAVEGGGGVDITLHLDKEDVLLSGRTGNGAFWAYGGGPGSPVLFVGTVSGKAPRLKLKARGVFAKASEFSEMTLSLKQSAAAVQGTAAAGAAIAGATVTLKDRHGTSVTAVTGADGRFVLDAAGLTPPFLLKVGTLYGVATEAGVANLHPLTDLILRTWYGVKGLDLATAFDTLDSSTPMPTAVEVELLEGLVRRAIQKWLGDEGLDPAAFDLIRTPFPADGTGFDAVLDGTTVAPDGSSMSVTDGTTTQESDFALSTVSGTVTVDTTVTSAAGTSESRDGTALPGDAAMQEAVAGGLAAMEAFRAKVNARGGALTATDLAPMLTADFLEQGETRVVWTAEAATEFRGATVGPVGLRSVASFDAGAGIVILDMVMPISIGDFSETDKFRMSFKKTGSAWLLHGDRLISDIRVGVEFRTDYFPWGIDGPRKHIQVQVTPLKGTIQSVSVSGGGIFSATAVPQGPGTRLVTLMPTPTTEVEFEYDMFYVGIDVAEYPAPGTEFQVTVTPVSGPVQVHTVVSGATTTESVSILQPTGNSLAADAHPGTPFTVRWTRPTTFAVERIEFSGSGYSPNFAEDVDADSFIPTTATEGTVTIPTTVGGETVDFADFYLSFTGPNGELIVVIYGFQ